MAAEFAFGGLFFGHEDTKTPRRDLWIRPKVNLGLDFWLTGRNYGQGSDNWGERVYRGRID